METLFCLSVALMAGLLMSRISKLLGLPAVTAYLVTGIIIGPYGLGKLGISGLGFNSLDQLEHYKLISEAALGFIAFAIGDEFRVSQLKRDGKQTVIVGIAQAVTATVVVDIVLLLIHLAIGNRLPVPAAITLGAIATATAPATTLMVVRQYKAKGRLTDLLMPIVALDDAVGLIIFAASFGVARAMMSGSFDLVSILVEPVLEIVASLLLGAVMGYLFTVVVRLFHSNSKRLCVSVAFVLLTIALAMLKLKIGSVTVGFSSLLVCMMLSCVFCNLCDFSEEIMGKVDRWTMPLFILFFVVSGAQLQLGVFGDIIIVLIGAAYVLSRAFGKCFGAWWSAKVSGCEPNVCRYLGFTLLPQEGVALGMTIAAVNYMGEQGQLVRTITLFAVLCYELTAPLITKIALTKSGNIVPKQQTQKV
ncbi:MAG: cation:proton antiporter [Clostridia bacterium]|nr:cation:proton antiporter [Clostridia bacterium]